jgi:hypothetical protein
MGISFYDRQYVLDNKKTEADAAKEVYDKNNLPLVDMVINEQNRCRNLVIKNTATQEQIHECDELDKIKTFADNFGENHFELGKQK